MNEAHLPDEELAELALGLLNGEVRADALGHVENCAHCSEELKSLSGVADGLLAVFPEAEPPVGFEVRALNRFSDEMQSHVRAPSRLRRSGLLAMAAIVAIVAGIGVGRLTDANRGTHSVLPTISSRPHEVYQSALTGNGRQLGRVLVSTGHPTLLVMNVDGVASTELVTCKVTTTDGKVVTVGSYWLSKGSGAWAATLQVPADNIRSADLTDTSGAVVAKATFASS